MKANNTNITPAERQVFNTLADLTDPTVTAVCDVTGIHVADVKSALARLVARGWVRQKGGVFYAVSPRAMARAD